MMQPPCVLWLGPRGFDETPWPLWFTYARLSQRLANSRICLWENRFFSKTAHPLTIGRGYFFPIFE
jgi:hypothetical protein